MRWCGAFLAGLVVVVRLPVAAQTATTPRLALDPSPIAISGSPRPGFMVASVGRRAALPGDETGSFEAWTWPLKLVRDLHLDFRVGGSDELSGASIARQVTTSPEGVVIVYSHPSFTVRQHAVVPHHEAGALLLLEVETARTLDILVRFHADFNVAWPGNVIAAPPAWNAERKAFVLTDAAHQLNGLVGSPFATGASERGRDARTNGYELVLRVDSGGARTRVLPVALAGGAAPRDSVAAVYERVLNAGVAAWREKTERYRRMRTEQLTIDSPDARLDLALEWAKVDLDQQVACVPELGCGFVSAFARTAPASYQAPSFVIGDGALGVFALDAVGALDDARQGALFALDHQRADGRIPTEVTQSARRVPWFTDYPQAWQSTSATPLWLRALYDYWLASGDTEVVRRVWPSITRAFGWCVGTDANGDGLMDSARGDVHLAGLWLAALEGTEQMARAIGDDSTARAAAATLRRASRSVEEQFWNEAVGQYSDVVRDAGNAAAVLTVNAAPAMAFGFLDPDRSNRMLRDMASFALTADWGVRARSTKDGAYDPLQPTAGAVTGSATGFAALAHYKYHRGWAGFDLVRDMARTTFDFARGKHPAALSGEFYQTLDASAPQDGVATSLFVTAFVRGLLGLEADVPHRALGIEPHLPADWSQLLVDNFRVGKERVSVRVRRDPGVYSVHLRRSGTGAPLRVRLSPALPLGARVDRITVNEQDVPVRVEETAHDVHPVVELSLVDELDIDIDYAGGADIVQAADRIEVGHSSVALHVIDFTRQGQDYVIQAEGVAGATYVLQLRTGGRVHGVSGADVVEQSDQRVTLRLTVPAAPAAPASAGYVRKEVRFRL